MTCCLLITTCVLGFAQQNTVQPKKQRLTLPKFAEKLSLTANVGTRAFAPSKLNQVSTHALKQINLRELGLSYRLTSKLSVGISTIGSLGNCAAGYLDDESRFVPFDDLLDDDDDQDETDEPDDDLGDMDDDDNDCEEEFGNNVMGTVTFLLSEKLPIYLQVAAGYAFSRKAPAYAAFAGYRQKLFSGLNLTGGIRYSGLLYRKPANAISLVRTTGLRPEVGLSWNF